MTTPNSSWSAPSPHLPAAQPAGPEETGLHVRPMGLKVHYSFDHDNQMHCLARWPHILQVQTVALDDKTTIGVVDLRTCLQAVAQSSPEILNQQEKDYSVYAYDYSETDVPLQQRRRLLDNQSRAESFGAVEQPGPDRGAVQNPSQDARSPADSIAQSPDHGYSPEDSTGDLGSSPPVPRTTPFLRSSPPPSSPVLPTLPLPASHVDSGFMSGGLEDFFDDEDILSGVPQDQQQDQMLPVPSPPAVRKSSNKKDGHAAQQQHQQQQQRQQQQQSNFPFQEVNPGPPELLPTKSIFNPAGKAKALNRHASAVSAQSAPKKSANRSLKRANTAPAPIAPEHDLHPQDDTTYQPNGPGLAQGPAQSYPSQEQISNDVADSTQPTAHPADGGYTESPQNEPASTPAVSMPIPERPEPEPALPVPTQPVSRPASRPPSSGVSAPPAPPPTVPANGSAPEPALTLPRPFTSEAPCPPSGFEPPRYSKNLVKKQSIKERLEIAIEKGESPPFCNNCGAIETPTWRKIWTQDHDGVPGFHEFSDKPGCVTMIEVLARDENEQPSRYRMVKKNLGPKDDKKQWTETILCNPCGIWLGKFKVHRPPDRWDKDFARLNQPRKKREPKSNNSRPKKARSRSDAQVNPTSEAYLTTDPIGPPGNDSPKGNYENGTELGQHDLAMNNERPLNSRSSPRQRLPGSTHSRGSGTADSPIAVEDDLGSTRRLLFSAPRRDGVPKVLGELSLNSVQTTALAPEVKSAAVGGENTSVRDRPGTPTRGHDDLEQELFGTPPQRPSTPPLQSAPGPFKTPTRSTPSHRPITRSISRSIRSIRSIPKSPGQLLAAAHLQRTPSKTPRSSAGGLGPGSTGNHKRRTPRSSTTHQHAQFALDAQEQGHQSQMLDMSFESPFSATLHQLLSEANEFIAGSPSANGAGLLTDDLDLSTIATQLDAAEQNGQAVGAASGVDFGSFLSTDVVMPSSPPLIGGDVRSGSGNAPDRLGRALH
ncbi:6c6f2a9b-d57c-40d5-9e2f-a46c24739c3f [Thermothielavioides terrestris]|uniref:6c6f2a9b-d57c-40d5-9e2f-a46c24739c3f n=1 Tax=Thermothielavioides terrestris TaxID=2587410 RepID=A0A3S4AMZ3_9PEZI|nr:6c6f2a9b-d57c-40d5-9e2f-a46c24739c3f [Thermothielavioides terrestris]